MNEELLDDLVAANRILAEHGVIDAYGHVSIRSPDDPKRFYLARAIAPETVQREDILEYDLDAQLDARGRDSRTSASSTARSTARARRDGGGAQPLAVGGALQRDRREDARPLPHGFLHRRRPAELRDPQGEEGPICSCGRRSSALRWRRRWARAPRL